ncbi:CDP-alcohol phosphatidyltransferase family protein [Hansschlegelia plantiphila]|uniref:CDP-diacylglycerol--glycerol-3-phosphate 3-phosphatidyltransferase n=1 Tax=Hansschlegelia plantiphila TaxID=374655 RepID=A0A9W6J0A2_9HYPH|nr:CDP-alcohol phosphatidyltransferase family protein [Hansschlegelia plantiphila]GLK67416.1 CDP-diacylglycerol--glycerol-3-phosphate 3-phosphatidyltransferase [Hansschlegelia plantiphila]
MNLPNILTVGRMLAVPLVAWFISNGQHFLAFWLFVLAGVTDALDGAIARRFDQRTELGAYLDPIADKALLVSIYVTLGMLGEIPALLVIAVVFRDLVIVAAVALAWAIEKPLPITPLGVSKANTVAQMIFAGVVLGADGFALDLSIIERPAAYLVGGLTLGSAGAYLVAFIRHMALTEPTPDA